MKVKQDPELKAELKALRLLERTEGFGPKVVAKIKTIIALCSESDPALAAELRDYAHEQTMQARMWQEMQQKAQAECDKEQAEIDAFVEWREQATEHLTYLIIQRGTRVTCRSQHWLTGLDGATCLYSTHIRQWNLAVEKEYRRIPKFVLRQLQPT